MRPQHEEKVANRVLIAQDIHTYRASAHAQITHTYAHMAWLLLLQMGARLATKQHLDGALQALELTYNELNYLDWWYCGEQSS